MGRGRYSGGAGRVALCAVMASFSLLGLYVSCAAPGGRLGLVAASGLLVAGAVVTAGPAAGAFCYAATGLLALLLLPAKENALLYLLFFGLYPLLKYWIERLGRLPPEIALKLVFFNISLTALQVTARAALLSGLPAVMEQMWALYLFGNLAFIAYDFGFSRCIAFYAARVDRALRR